MKSQQNSDEHTLNGTESAGATVTPAEVEENYAMPLNPIWQLGHRQRWTHGGPTENDLGIIWDPWAHTPHIWDYIHIYEYDCILDVNMFILYIYIYYAWIVDFGVLIKYLYSLFVF